MFSHKYKSIFVHIPKAAGTSIEKKLEHFEEPTRGVQDHRTIREVEPLGLDYFTNLYREDNLFLLMRRMKNGLLKEEKTPTIEQYNTYFKFTFVRNPWSRAVSWYKNVIRDDIHRHSHNIKKDCTFEEFFKVHLDNTWALRSQLFWLRNYCGNLPLDFIGRFERLDEDFAKVCERLEIPDGNLPKLIMSESKPYTDYYNNELVDIIAKKYKDEISYFGFQYGE